MFDKPKDKGGKRIGTVLGWKVLRGFFTPSGKVELFSPWLADKKDARGKTVNPLPAYEKRDWQPSEKYPLYLVNWKEASHTHTRTQNNPWLLDIKPLNPLVIHPETAERFGVADGDAILVESPYGRVKAVVKVSRRIHCEVVGLQHGFGHTALGSNAKVRGTPDATPRLTKADPLSGRGLHKENWVRIVKA